MFSKNKIFYLLAVLASFFVFSFPAHAQNNIIVSPIAYSNIYANDFDVLVYDFNIQLEKDDYLQTITMAQTGTIRVDIEMSKVVFWKDNGPAGFQGMGIDDRLGKADYDGSFYFMAHLNIDLYKGDNRFFVTIETANRNFSAERSIYFSLPIFSDQNHNNKYESGDSGLFFNSNLQLPTDETLQTYLRLKTNRTDTFAPKIVITSNKEEKRNSFLMGGEVRDRGIAGLNSVEIQITPLNGVSGAWMPVIFGTRFWIFDANLANGNYLVKLRALDNYNNETITDGMNLKVNVPVAVQ